MRVPLCNLHSFMTNLGNRIGGFEAGNRRLISVHGHLHAVAGLCCRTQEAMSNGRQERGDSSEILRTTAAVRHLCERLGELDAHGHHLRIQLYSMQDTFDHKQSKFSALCQRVL